MALPSNEVCIDFTKCDIIHYIQEMTRATLLKVSTATTYWELCEALIWNLALLMVILISCHD